MIRSYFMEEENALLTWRTWEWELFVGTNQARRMGRKNSREERKNEIRGWVKEERAWAT